jgi:hypothetical protein
MRLNNEAAMDGAPGRRRQEPSRYAIRFWPTGRNDESLGVGLVVGECDVEI